MQRQDQTLGAGRAARDARAALDPGQMLVAALKRAHCQGFRDRSFVQPLQRLIDSCNREGHLNALGRQAVRFEVRRSLGNLLRFEQDEELAPSLLLRPIERPIFITGMPRSGSTFLHRLLVRDPQVAAPLSWQLVHPHPCRGGRLGQSLERTGVEAQFLLMRLLAPRLNSLHEVAAAEPEECTDITAQVFQSLRYDSVYRVPSYQSWLQHQGHDAAYRFHKRFLQHLDALTPARQWILKSPDHIFAFDAAHRVYPDARWIFLHRDPVAVLASVAKLTEVLRRPFSRHVDLAEIGRQVRDSWLDGASRMMRAAAAGENILHLQYREVIAAPLAVVERVRDHGGFASSAQAGRRMRQWLVKRSNRRHRQRQYDLGAFGLDPAALRERFRPYTDAFAIELEWPAAARSSHRARA